MLIEKVLGIVLTPDGQEHPFGIHKMADVNDLEEENYHDYAFQKEIASSPWFKSLGITYDLDNPLRTQIFDLTSYGLTFILNGCSKGKDKELYIYTIQCPDNLSPEVIQYFQDHYSEYKELIDKHNALFQGEAYHNGEYVDDKMAFYFDEFYDCMHIPKSTKHSK